MGKRKHLLFKHVLVADSMKNSFSDQYKFLNNVGNGLLEIKQSQIKEALECFKTKPNERMMVYLVAEPSGRTQGAARVGLAELSTFRKRVSYDEPTRQPGHPGRTIYDIIPEFEKDYDKILILAASYSGTKKTVTREFDRIDRRLDKFGKSNKMEILYITGNPEGQVGRIVTRYNGKIVDIKKKNDIDENEYRELGFLGDVSELETAYLTRELTEMSYNGSDAGEFHNNIEKHFEFIGSKFDSEGSTVFFNNLSDALGSQTDGYCASAGGGGLLVSETARTRWDQLKRRYLRDSKMFVMGGNHNWPPPLPGNIILSVTLSGGGQIYEGTKDVSYLVDLCRMSKERRTENFCITGKKDAPVPNLTPKDNILLIEDDTSKPCYFYTDSLMANSLGAIKTVDKLIERGIIDKYIASVFKEGHHIG